MAAIQHMVLVRFKPVVSDETINKLFDQVARLKDLIPGIEYFAGGPYSSPEGLNKGFSNGFLITFDTAQSRDAYLPHPEHERVKASILPLIEDAVAFDFEVRT